MEECFADNHGSRKESFEHGSHLWFLGVFFRGVGRLVYFACIGPGETLRWSMKSSSHRRALVSPGTAQIEFDKLDVFTHLF